MLHVCPTVIIYAPAERVWELVAVPQGLAQWTGMRVIDGPDRELRAGDQLVLGARIAPCMRVVFTVGGAVRPRRLDLHIRLPLGVTNDEAPLRRYPLEGRTR
jgi:uncharacterized protein YndB with AHSA1/START domain